VAAVAGRKRGSELAAIVAAAFAVAAGCLGICCGRPESSANPPADPPPVIPTTASASSSIRAHPPIAGRRLIVIGWDGADWDLLDALRTQGRMPNLERFISGGRTAALQVFRTTISPMVWSTLATGAEPPDHGVLDFFEIDPASGQQVPVTSRSLRVPPFWEIASRKGQTAGVVNYWATYPAEEINGFVISDRVSPTLADPDPKQLSSALSPPSEAARLREVLAAVPAVGAADLQRLGQFTQAEASGKQGQMLTKLLRNTSSVEALAEDFYDRLGPQSLILYFLGTDEIDHMFGRETAPRLPCVSPQDFARLSEVVPRYYARMDEYLGRWMERAEKDGADILLVSDHGFLWGNRRSCGGNPLQWRSAGASHRPVGIAAVWGKDVVASAERSTIDVFDVEPTIAAVLGLPVDRKASGTAQTDWFRQVPAPERQDLWGSFPRPRRLPFVAPAQDEYAQRLRTLGYLTGQSSSSAGPLGGDRPGWTATGWLNLGNYWSARGKRAEAVGAFRKSLELWPGYPAAEVDLAAVLIDLGRISEAMAVARGVLEAGGEGQDWAVYEIAARLEAARRVAEAEAFLREAVKRFPKAEPVVVSLAGLELGRGRCQEAFDLIQPFVNGQARPDDYNVAGLSLKCLRRDAEAAQMLQRSLALNPNQPAIRAALGVR
jgi:predicted AlkP superfamily phosphohydrolase/phosphomutase